MKSFDDHPFQLAAGANMGPDDPFGCLMNVVSWMNGDTQITDHPSCTNRVLGSLCMMFNDEVIMKFGVPGRRISDGEFQVFANVATPDQAMRMTHLASLVMDTAAVSDVDAFAWRDRVAPGHTNSWNFVRSIVRGSASFDEAFDRFMTVVNHFRSTFAVELGLKDDAHV